MQYILSCVLWATITVLSLGDDTVRIILNPDELIGDRIESDFVSFSFEISGFPVYVGPDPNAPKASFLQLLMNLKSPDTRGPNLRIGGNSADVSWWNPDGNPRPVNITYDIKPADLISVVNIAKLINGSVVFDLNMRQPTNPLWAVNHVKAIEQYVGFDRVRGLEIGNEPDVFAENGIRAANFTFGEYETQFNIYAQAIYDAGVPKPIIQGGTFCHYYPAWNNSQYLEEFKPFLSSISYHRYTASHCHEHKVTLPELLADDASTHQAVALKPYIITAKSLGIPFYIGEGNSISCGGMPGVSNVFGAALWVVDFLFNMASVNVKGMNFHGGKGAFYTAINYNDQNDNVPDVRPLYYGLWLVSSVTKNGATIIVSEVMSSNAFIKVWSVKDINDVITVVVIHKDPTTTNPAQVSIASPKKSNGQAVLSVLKSATGVDALYGISYGGQTFDGSTDGLPVGTRVEEKISPDTDGDYRFTLSPATIAVIQLPKT